MAEETVSREERREFDVSAAADRVVPLAETEATYFQSAIADDRSALVVAFCELPSTEVRQEMTDAAGGVPLQIRLVRHSWARLRAVMDPDQCRSEALGARGHSTVRVGTGLGEEPAAMINCEREAPFAGVGAGATACPRIWSVETAPEPHGGHGSH